MPPIIVANSKVSLSRHVDFKLTVLPVEVDCTERQYGERKQRQPRP